MEQKRDNFSNRFGVLVAVAGSAIGLGNIWRFPYLVGQNGGAVFIFIYLLCIFICIPIMVSEFIIGRRSQANAYRATKKLTNKSGWNVIGIISVLCSILILSFYCVVGGWTLDYIVQSLSGSFFNASGEELSATFQKNIQSPFRPTLLSISFLLITALIVSGGIQKGIEKYSKILMPVLFVLTIFLAIRSITLPNAREGFEFLFKPDFSKLTGQSVLAAMGQAFFSLSLGMGCIITYGSYVKKDENLTKMSLMGSLADIIFALIAAIAVIPAVFAFNISPEEGPSLVFVTLPQVFAQMKMGGIVAFVFFFIVLIAALTSSISILEVPVATMCEEFKLKRSVSVLIITILLAVLVSLCSLSQGILSDFTIFNKNIFDLFDYLTANILIPIGSIFIVLFVGWKLNKYVIKDELTNGGTLSIKMGVIKVITFFIRYVAPIVITIVLINGLI